MTRLGTSGVVAGVTVLLGALRTDWPTALRAAIEKLKDWPLVNPVTSHEVAVVAHATLPLRSVTV